MSLKNYEIRNVRSQSNHNDSSRTSDESFSPTDLLLRLVAIGLALLCLAAKSAHACGVAFPNNLLEIGDRAVLIAPTAEFRAELERMHLTSSSFAAVTPTNGYAEQTFDADINDLTLALKSAKVASEAAERIVENYRKEREKLKAYSEEWTLWSDSRPWYTDENGGHYGDAITSPPQFPAILVPADLPIEFADYFEGAIAWHNPTDKNKAGARAAWERLLKLPATERKYKSTWAAFMLGKALEEEDPDKAAGCFRQVRELIGEGFVDSIGLATASLGLEGRIAYAKKDYRAAIDLYLEQLAGGDASAVVSLQRVAESALGNAESLRVLARDVKAQKVITAALISSPPQYIDQTESNEEPNEIVTRWLHAVEQADINDVDSAEKLALAAYQAGSFDVAQRWINRAKESPVAQWIQAKLYLRAGKIQQGANLLAKVSQRLPIIEGEATSKPTELADSLSVPFDRFSYTEPPARRQILGELGVLRLSRREYVQAFDALLNADYWIDAAYVGERVLTTDELKQYIDTAWPPHDKSTEKTSHDAYGENIRYLLARRLTREFRSGEARAYYPSEQLPSFDNFIRELSVGWNEGLFPDQRARALFNAAFIARTNGMELLATEVQPDWHTWDGRYQEGVTWETRSAEGIPAKINVASPQEIERATNHKTDPDERFHYRFQAAALAWEAAKLMPNQRDDTAFVLWTGGSWIKDQDPVAADLFYKTLVRRCRNTALGAEADYLHWFPTLDSNGQLLPRERPAITEFRHGEKVIPSEDADSLTNETPEPDAEPELADEEMARAPTIDHGYEYTMESGDTIIAIVRAFNQAGVGISVDDVLAANPRIEPTKIPTGSTLIIPAEPLASPDVVTEEVAQ